MPTRGKARKIGVRVDSRPVFAARQNGELADSASRSGEVHAHPVGHVDRLVGIVEAHVHVDAEDQLLARHELQARDQVAIARPRDDPLVLPHGEGMGARRADREATAGGDHVHRPPQLGELAARLRGVLARRGGDLAHRLHQLGLHVALGAGVGEIGQQALDRVGQVEGLLIHDHQLLLDPEGVAGAREPVLHRGDRNRGGRRQTRSPKQAVPRARISYRPGHQLRQEARPTDEPRIRRPAVHPRF